jgi:hypothetical protein
VIPCVYQDKIMSILSSYVGNWLSTKFEDREKKVVNKLENQDTKP